MKLDFPSDPADAVVATQHEKGTAKPGQIRSLATAGAVSRDLWGTLTAEIRLCPLLGMVAATTAGEVGDVLSDIGAGDRFVKQGAGGILQRNLCTVCPGS